MRTSSKDKGMFGGRSSKRDILIGAKALLCALMLCGPVLPAAARTKIFNTSSATISNLPAGAQSAVSAALGRDQEGFHAAAVRKGYRMRNPRTCFQATFTRQGVRIEDGKASWGMALAAFGTSGKLQPVAAAKPEANKNRVEYRRGALTEWYVNGPAGLEQGFTIAKAPAGSANGTIELEMRLTGNLTASVDAAKTGLFLKGRQAGSLRYTGLEVRDAKGRKLRSWLEVRNGRLLVQVATAGATYPLVVDPYIQVAKLVDPNGAAGDQLGRSVAMSGDGSTVVALNTHGDAYVFSAVSNWEKPVELTPSAPSTLSRSMASFEPQQVAVSNNGSVVVVGSPGVNSSAGAAFVFVASSKPGGWSIETSPLSQNTLLLASDQDKNHYLGYSVAVSADGKTVVAGAPNAPGDVINGTSGQGAAYVFEEPGTGWGGGSSVPLSEAAKLVASDGQTGDSLGASVAISADGLTVAVGASGFYAQGGAALKVMQAPVITKGLLTKTEVSGSLERQQLPIKSVSTLSKPTSAGAAYVFVRSGGGWTGTATSPQFETAKLYASDGQIGDLFGQSVAINGDGSTVVAGAPHAPYNDGSGEAGMAYVFGQPAGGWSGTATSPQHETAELAALEGNAGGGMGASVAVSADGSTVAAGAPGDLNDSKVQTGAVYVFSKPSGGWIDANTPQYETDKAFASDGALNDELGWSTSISSDGLTVAAGALQATVNSNTEQGAAYVFTSTVPFSLFDASKMTITQGPPSAFTLTSSFVLGADSNGINPLTEPVTLKIDSLSLMIPAGSFRQPGNGIYMFSGAVDGFTVDAKFQYLGANEWVLRASGSSPDAFRIANPVTVTLTIGNDSGTVTETVPIN